MWEQYGVPADEPELRDNSTASAGREPGGRLSISEEFGTLNGSSGVVRAGGTSSSSTVIAAVAFAFCLIFAIVAVVSSANSTSTQDTDRSEYSDWYECIAEEEADGSGILSPADLCEIGNDRPPGYVDTYEFDPFDTSNY